VNPIKKALCPIWIAGPVIPGTGVLYDPGGGFVVVAQTNALLHQRIALDPKVPLTLSPLSEISPITSIHDRRGLDRITRITFPTMQTYYNRHKFILSKAFFLKFSNTLQPPSLTTPYINRFSIL
jgi:hypothetical protein